MQSATFVPVRESMLAATGFRPQPGDSLFNVQSSKVLFPSPASGRGSRLFLLVHVLVHVTSLITSIVLLAQAGSKLNDDGVQATQAALTLSFVTLLLGIGTIVGISAATKRPFDYSFGLVAIVWLFLCSFGLLLLASIHISNAVDSTHASRVTCLFAVLFQSLGLAFVYASIASGLSASIPSEKKVAAIAQAVATGTMMPMKEGEGM